MNAERSRTAHRVSTRLAGIGVATVAAVAGLGVTSAPAAHAESDAWGAGSLNLNSRCSGLGFGTVIRDDHLGGGVRLQVFYSSRDGGTNCANLLNTAGGAKDLEIYLSFPNADGGGARDSGRYSSYAGSVLLKGTSNSCIDVMSRVNGKSHDRMGVHCG